MTTNPVNAKNVNHNLLVSTGSAYTNLAPHATSGTPLCSAGASADPAYSTTPTVSSITISNSPSVGTDGVNKTYADAIAAFTSFQVDCAAATTANLNAAYLNGAAGIGATLTNLGALAAFQVDGYSASSSDRILVKNQTDQTQNGIYTVTTLGNGAVAWILTRAADYNQTTEISAGDFVPVLNGTTQASTFWVQLDTVTTIGTDPIAFQIFGNITTPITVSNGGTGRSTLTAHNLIFGNGTSAVTLLAPSATSGVPLISQGSSSDPIFGTALIAGGGSGSTSFNTYGPVVAGSSSTAALTSVSPSSTVGIPFVSNGNAANPVFSTAAIAGGGTGVTSVTTSPTASSFAGWDANKNLSANSFLQGYTTTVTSAGTKTLVVGDTEQQYFTGSTTHTVVLPVTSTLALGQSFTIVNNSSGAVTVQSSGLNTIQVLGGTTQLIVTVISTSGTGTSSWSQQYNSQITAVSNGGTGATTLTGVLTGNGTSAVTANAVTQYYTLTGGASNAVNSVSPSTANFVLTSNGISSQPTFKAIQTSGSFTPTITFGRASVGITYGTQFGQYTQIGNLLFYVIKVVLTNKGSSTGICAIEGWPVTSTVDTVLCAVSSYQGVTLTAGYQTLCLANIVPSGFADVIQNGSGVDSTYIQNTNCTNSLNLQVSGIAFTS